MDLENRINILRHLAQSMNPEYEEVQLIAEQAFQHNRWFTIENILLSLANIRTHFLSEEKLNQWLSAYQIHPKNSKWKIGLVMAGNIPLVGFHDLLCVMLSGHKAIIKLSSKDHLLIPWILKKLSELDGEWANLIKISDSLKDMDAVIATGSNNSSRYFEYYFAKYPHIIRKNRGSVAVLTGEETEKDLQLLGFDMLSYFGLGCRNVSKLLVPAGYAFDHLFESIRSWRFVIDHNKYKNNYDYNRTLLLMNKEPHFANEFLMIREDKRIVSPVAMVHYETYHSQDELDEILLNEQNNIQCIAGSHFIPFGKTQSPELWNYADGVDTMKFLTGLTDVNGEADLS